MNLPEPISDSGPEIDLPLLRKVVDWAAAEDEKPEVEREWYQGTWIAPASVLGRNCGTAYCIAGYVGHLHGFVAATRGTEHVADFAQGALGLTDLERAVLFSGGNTIQEIRHYAERIAARAGERL